MKNIIALLSTIIVVALMALSASRGGAYHGGEAGKVIEDIGNKTAQSSASTAPKDKSDEAKELDALNALRQKAGNVGGFKVSDKYKRKCSSCHGVNGSGFQNGKKMMGAKLFGLKEESLLKSLRDFKAGRKENVVMKGLLMSLNDEDLKELSKEIGQFPAKAEAVKNK